MFIAGNRCTAKDSAWHHAAIRLLVEFAFRRQTTVVGYIQIFFNIFLQRVHSFRIDKMNTDRLIMPQHGCIVQMCSNNYVYTVSRAIISRGLYIYYHIFGDDIFVFKEFFQKILSLCMVSIQEWVLIKRGLMWRAYSI